MKLSSKKIIIIVTAIIALYGLLLRYEVLRDRNLWVDEIYQFEHMYGKKIKPFWSPPQSYGDFSSFPGEYILNYHTVVQVGMNKWGLAIPHAFMTILGFFLLYKVGQYYFSTWIGYGIAFLIYALNITLIFHSLEFRPYGVLQVLSLASLLIAHQLIRPIKNWSIAKTFLIGIVVVSIVNYHIYGIAIFLLPLITVFLIHSLKEKKQNIVGLWSDRQERLRRIILGVFLAVSLIIWRWYASYLQWGHDSSHMLYTFDFIPNPAQNIFEFIKVVLCNLVGNKYLYILGTSLVVSLFFPIKEKIHQWIHLGLLVILPILLILDSDIRNHYWFIQRQFIWVIPFFVILLAWQWESMIKILINKIKT